MKEILKESKRNKMTVISNIIMDKYYIDDETLKRIQIKSISQISDWVSQRAIFEEEMIDCRTRRLSASLYVFTEDELLNFISYVRKTKHD